MRVLLDVSPITADTRRHTGIARVALNLAKALHQKSELSCCAWGSVSASEEVANFAELQDTLRFCKYKRSVLEKCYLQWVSRDKTAMPFLKQWVGRGINVVRDPVAGIDLSAYDVVHSTYARFPRKWRLRKQPRVLTIHDLTALRLTNAEISRSQKGITQRIIDSVNPDDWLVFISEFTKQDFLEYKWHPHERLVVIPNGVDTSVFRPAENNRISQSVRDRLGIGNRPFLFTLSSLAPHKNLAFLLEVWQRVISVCPEARLVISGGRTESREAIFRSFSRSNNVLDSCVFTGFLPDTDFVALASSCNAFMFPSLYEGFGLPVLEAMACGAYVIASNNTALPEVLGNTGQALDPSNADLWCDAMINALKEVPRGETRDASVKRSLELTWDRAADQYLSFYRRAVSA